jgi:UDP-N-acetyl-2-amino-2-deoxyglucuronate dehydrogenase
MCLHFATTALQFQNLFNPIARNLMAEHGFGIIGCGMIAEYHTKAINEIQNARVVAAYSRSEKNGQKIAALAQGGCALYDDLDQMLAHPGLDVVCVCTPSGAHLEPSVQAARAGKHVVVEKPLEITLPRCDAIIRACDEAGVRLCTIFPSRFTEANCQLKQAIDAGRFGRITLGDTYVKWWRTQEYYDSGGWRGTWQLDGGGALMNQAIHNVDLLYWLMGDVETITALTATLAHERIEVEDTAVAALRFKNGALGVIEAATSAYPGLLKRTEIHGDGGSARVEQDDITLWSFRAEAPGDATILAKLNAATGFKAGASDPRGITHIGHRDQLIDFLRAIDEGHDPLVDGREGRKSVEIIRAIYRSAQTGQAVRLPLEEDRSN